MRQERAFVSNWTDGGREWCRSISHPVVGGIPRMPKTGCGAEPPCLFGRKSVHKSGCFRVSSVKYDNRCEKDGGLSVGEGKSGETREREREVNLVRPPRLKVTGDVFVQPFPQREPLSTRPCWILSSFSEKVCRLLVQRINSWVNELVG